MRQPTGLKERLDPFHLSPFCRAAENFKQSPIDADVVRETGEVLNRSRQVFAFKLGVNPRTLERWEQGRSKPNEQAAALIWLVRKYLDTLKRLESLAASACG